VGIVTLRGLGYLLEARDAQETAATAATSDVGPGA